MAEKAAKDQKTTKTEPKGPVKRNFPEHTLLQALAVPQKIQDEKAGKPFKRLLLADALGIKPSSSNFRVLLSSSNRYGLTEGNEKSAEISLTVTGADATQLKDATKRRAALRKSAMTPPVFAKFYREYTDRKLPSPEMMRKLLVADYAVPSDKADECANIIVENGRYAELVRDIGGSPHVLLDNTVETDIAVTNAVSDHEDDEAGPAGQETAVSAEESVPSGPIPSMADKVSPPRAIFIGHGKNHTPLERLQKILSSFQIPFKVVVDEPQLGRPIPKKVKDTMQECGSAILIFTRDERFFDKDQNEIWLPSENVVYELGAASFAYEDRVVIFKEKGIRFPTNFQSVGYIEFEVDNIESKTTELLKELIGFGLVRITTA